MTCWNDMVFDGGRSPDNIDDLLTLMRHQERTTYERLDYLSSVSSMKDAGAVVDATWRQRIVEWMFGVVDTCGLRRDSVAVAAYYLDLCVGKGLVRSREDFQLAAMTALQLAIKLYDSTVMKLESMVKLGRGLFSKEDVVVMESKILQTLNWQVHPPTAVCFLRQYLRLLPEFLSPLAVYMIGEVTRFVSEISVCIYKLSRYAPSTMAYAGMLIAMERIDTDLLPHWQRQQLLHVMATVAQMDSGSMDVTQAVRDVHISLEKNMSIDDLIRTISAHCQVGFRDAHANVKNETRLCEVGGSPRDVRMDRRA